MALQAGGLAWIAADISGGTTYGELVLPLVIAGIGISMVIPATPTAALGSVPPADIGKASGVQNTLQRFGAVFGVAIGSAVFAAYGGLGSPAAVTAGFRPALWACSALAGLGVLAALAMSPRPKQVAGPEPKVGGDPEPEAEPVPIAA
jgi:hypothetical protein